MHQHPHLTIRGKAIALVYQYNGIIRAESADWTHKLKRGETRSALLDWAREKYYTNNLTVERLPMQAKATLKENEAEATQVATMKRIRDAIEDDEVLATQLRKDDEGLA